MRQVSTRLSLVDWEALVPVSRSPARTFSRIDMAGNGLGFWNTMPIDRRASMSRLPGS